MSVQEGPTPGRPAVVVVGSLNVDLSVRVPQLPGPGETVLGGPFRQSGGGKGANQAVAASRLGARVWLIADVGADGFGEGALAELGAEGIDISMVQQRQQPTGVALIVVDDRGENLIAVASGANCELDPARVTSCIERLPVDRAVLLACHEVPDQSVLAAARAAHARGYQVLLNPAPARPLSSQLLDQVQVVICNQGELASIAPSGAAGLLGRGPEAVVVTLGSDGADLYVRGQPRCHLAPDPVEAVDATGAGDTFCGAFASRLSAGASLEDAARFAVVAAGISVSARGAREGMPRRDDLRDRLPV